MSIGLPSFYFPLRQDDGTKLSQTLLTTVDDRHYSLSAIVIFFFLQIFGGHLGVPFVLLTLYIGKGVRRHPMLVNFLVTFVIYSTSFCILLYLGKQFGAEPSHGFCTVQASLIYGTAILTPMAGLSFVLNLWFSLRAMEQSKSVLDNTSVRSYMLLAAPYIAFVIFVTFTAAYGGSNPELLTRNRYLFYCTINSRIVDIIPAIAALIMLTIIVFEALVAIKLYRMHKAFVNTRTNGGPPLHLVVRVGVFSVYSFLSIVACIGFWSRTGAELPYVIQASLPTAAFIIFGTQRDILEAWGVIRIWHIIKNKHRAIQVVEIPKPKPLLDSTGY